MAFSLTEPRARVISETASWPASSPPSQAGAWIGALAPMHAPAWLGGLLAGQLVVSLMTRARGSVNEKAKRELGWAPGYASWRDGFRDWAKTAEQARAA